MQVILQNQEISHDKDWRLLKDTPGFLTLPCFYRLRFFSILPRCRLGENSG